MLRIKGLLSAATILLAAMAMRPAFGPASSQARASTSCVNPGGKSGCFSTIGAAVMAASAGDAIKVARGTQRA